MHEDALRQLLALRNANPHGLLGAHQAGDDVFFRVFRPEATAGRGGHGWQAGGAGATPRVPRDLRRAAARGRRSPPTSWSCTSPGGLSREKDPYAFLPTLGPADLHFVGEGRHRRLWDRLGAHPLTHQGVGGTAFVVWAPNARGRVGGGRLQPLGRPAAPDALAGRLGVVGALRARRPARQPLQVRDLPARRRAVSQGRPDGLPHRAAAAVGLGGAPARRLRLGRRRLAAAAGEARTPRARR